MNQFNTLIHNGIPLTYLSICKVVDNHTQGSQRFIDFLCLFESLSRSTSLSHLF